MLRRLLIAALVLLLLAGLLVGAAVLGGPSLGRWYLQEKALPRLSARLGLELRAEQVEVGLGTVHLAGLTVASPHDRPGAPLARLRRIRAELDLGALWQRKVTVRRLSVATAEVSLYRPAAGKSNYGALLRRLGQRKLARAVDAAPAGWSVELRQATLAGGALEVRDLSRGLTLGAASLSGSFRRGEGAQATLGKLRLDEPHLKDPLTLRRATVTLARDPRTGRLSRPRLSVEGGRLRLLPRLTLSGVRGTITRAKGVTAGGGRFGLGRKLAISLDGSYGGAEAKLWSASGWIDLAGRRGRLDVEASRFSLGRIASLLRKSPVIRPEQTHIAGTVRFTLEGQRISAGGQLQVSGLNLFHPGLAREAVLGIDGEVEGKGVLDLAGRRFTLERLALRSGGVEGRLTGGGRLVCPEEADLDPKKLAGSRSAGASGTDKDSKKPKKDVRKGDKAGGPRRPAGGDGSSTGAATASTDAGQPAHCAAPVPVIDLRLEVPAVPCQKVLDAIPEALVPHLKGFALRGNFAVDLKTHIDFNDLDDLTLGGSVGIRRCRVSEAPPWADARRLAEPFEHAVEVLPGQQLVFTVGPDNPDFTPLASISPFVTAALLTTEDGGFFRHRGFIPSQFRNALARNLKRGGFRLGASTISMQMVKNVLLSHEKTLSRKLQELFLTWYLERELSKERILEIYLNAIEFGPGIFGIGAAAQHYFGKHPADLTALEAAFFATLLPSPKRRYVQYCLGALSEKWDRYVRRVLRRMWQKKRITDVEYEQAQAQTLTFARDLELLPTEDCQRGVEDLLDRWYDERRRRLRQVVERAAPHQLELHLPPISAKDRAARRRRDARDPAPPLPTLQPGTVAPAAPTPLPQIPPKAPPSEANTP